MSRLLLTIAATVALTASLFAQKTAGQPAPGQLTLNIWPHGAPGASASVAPEVDTTNAKDDLIGGKPLIRLGNVSVPTLTVYAPRGTNTGAAVVVFPGGGYHILAVYLEGTEVCDWLNSVGIAWVLVNYRVPTSGLVPNRRPHCRTRSELTAWFVHAPAGGTLIRSASVSSDSLRERTCRRLSALTSNSVSTIRSMTPTRLAAVPTLR